MGNMVGIDTGGTLTKIAHVDREGNLKLEVFQSNNMEAIKNWLGDHPEVEEIGLTGGRTEQLKDVLKTMKSITYMLEFEATLKGVKYLLKRDGHHLDKAIITNIGTGTSIHYMQGDEHERISGTGIGGGTLVGLGALTTGESDFDSIKALAAQGDRSSIDLLVQDIYQGMDTPISGTLTASNFGKVGITKDATHPKEDVLATVQGLVGEVITTLSIQLAKERSVDHIVYIGSTLTDNQHLKDVISHYTNLKKHKPVFLNYCGFSGAIGALLNIREYHEEHIAK
jgi:type II pantothenate kinase